MKSILRGSNTVTMAALLVVGVLVFMTTSTFAAPHIFSNPGYYSSLSYENQNPEYLLQTLARLRQALIAEEDLENKNPDVLAEQRNNHLLMDTAINHLASNSMDLGVARGRSGSIEAVERTIQELAESPSGPGNYSKRGLDLGLGRGYSGSQAAKHLMGLAAANFAGGPGRRRRSEESA